MKYFLADDLLDFTWNQVVCAFWQKYPNPQRYIMALIICNTWTTLVLQLLYACFFKTGRIIVLPAAYRRSGGGHPLCCLPNNFRSLCPIITKFGQNVYLHNFLDKFDN